MEIFKFVSLFGLFLLVSCVYPLQHFVPGSVLDSTANPQVGQLNNFHQVLVAVVDSGVDYTHPGLTQNIRQNSNGVGVGLDLLGQDGFPFPIILDPATGEILEDFLSQNNHGTHVASLATLGGYIWTQDGRKLDAGKLIGLVPVRALPVDSEGLSDEATAEEVQQIISVKIVDYLIKAMEYASYEGVRVANFSIGIDANELKDERAREIYVRKMKTELYPNMLRTWFNILFVFAAGNEAMEVVDGYFPASFKGKNMLTVGALNNNGEIAEYSNFGEKVDVYIQGTDINGMAPGGNRAHMSGTSMATPLIANLAAKIFLLAPCLSASQARDLIISESRLVSLPVAKKASTRQVRVADFQKTLAQAREVSCH